MSLGSHNLEPASLPTEPAGASARRWVIGAFAVLAVATIAAFWQPWRRPAVPPVPVAARPLSLPSPSPAALPEPIRPAPEVAAPTAPEPVKAAKPAGPALAAHPAAKAARPPAHHGAHKAPVEKPAAGQSDDEDEDVGLVNPFHGK